MYVVALQCFGCSTDCYLQDFDYVKLLSEAVVPASQSPFYTELQYTRGLPDTVLVCDVQRALQRGHFVLVKDYPSTLHADDIQWTEDSLYNHFSLPMQREMQLLGKLLL